MQHQQYVHGAVVVKKKLSQKAKLIIISIFSQALGSKHKNETAEVDEMSFLRLLEIVCRAPTSGGSGNTAPSKITLRQIKGF